MEYSCPAVQLRLFHQDKGWGFVTSEEITGLVFGKAWIEVEPSRVKPLSKKAVAEDIFLHNKALNDSGRGLDSLTGRGESTA